MQTFASAAGVVLLFLPVAIGVLTVPAYAAGLGSIDTSFGSTNPTDGVAAATGSGAVEASALDGAAESGGADPIVVGGYQVVSGTQEMAMARFTSAGKPDSTFGSSGVATAGFTGGSTSEASGTAVNANGSVVAAGYDASGGQESPAIAQFSAGGTLQWASAATLSSVANRDPSIGGSFSAIGVDGSGRIVAAGVIGIDSGGSFVGERVVVARYNPSTSSASLDTSFDGTGYYLSPAPMSGLSTSGGPVLDSVSGIAIDGAGDIYVVGSTPLSNGCTEAFVLELSANGTPVSSFGSNGAQFLSGPSGSTCTSLTATAVQLGDGSSMPVVVVGGAEVLAGAAPSQGVSVLFGLNGNGSFDASFGTPSTPGVVVSSGAVGTVVEINSIALVPSSTTDSTPSSIVVSGLAYKAGSTPAVGVARYELDGVLDTTFGTAGTSTALPCLGGASCGAAVVVQPNADIDVSGGLAQAALSVAQLVQREVSVEPAPTVSVTGSTAPNAQFSIVYNGPALVSTVTVAYTTVTGTAVAGTNYEATSGTATFAPGGATTVTVSVPVLVPVGATGDVTFSLQLSNAVGAGVGLASGTATIDYPPPASQAGNSGTVVTGSSPSSPTSPGGSTPTVTLPTAKSASPAPGKGYWVVSSTGIVTSLGDAPDLGSVPARSISGKIVGLAATSDGLGYWVLSSSGQVFVFGNAKSHGSVAKKKMRGKAIALHPTSNGGGYWIASTSGQVFTFGNAHSYGSEAKPSGPIVGFAVESNGKGYWLASRKGNVYSFGAAKSHGSKTKPPSAIVAFAVKSGNGGYWLVAKSGTVYAFGTAHTYPAVTTAKSTKKTKPVAVKFDAAITGFTTTPNGAGYWLVTSKGTVYAFGNAGSYGSSSSGAVGVVAS